MSYATLSAMLLPLAFGAVLAATSDFGKKGRDIVEDCRTTTQSRAGEKLSDAEVTRIALDWISCVSYLQGFAEGSYFLCIPAGVTPSDMGAVIVKYGDNHPEKLYEPRGDFTFEALSGAYPCKKGQ